MVTTTILKIVRFIREKIIWICQSILVFQIKNRKEMKMRFHNKNIMRFGNEKHFTKTILFKQFGVDNRRWLLCTGPREAPGSHFSQLSSDIGPEKISS